LGVSVQTLLARWFFTDSRRRFNLALAFFVPPSFTNIQWRSYMIFGTFCIVMTVHVFFFYPETVKKSLEEIDHLFDGSVPAWRSAHAVKTFDQKVADIKEAGGMGEHKELVSQGQITV
jgi:hypothetical protein